MPTADDIRWFKQQFRPEIEAALLGTPFDLDMIVAIGVRRRVHLVYSAQKAAIG